MGMDRSGKDLNLPMEFSGEAQLVLFTRYGDPRDPGWENKWLTTWHIREAFPWFPADTITLHKHFKPLLEKALSILDANGLYKEIKTFDGAFEVRGMGAHNIVLSTHSWGAAIDLNGNQNPIGSNGVWSEPFIAAMQQANIFCGQNWTGRKDPKHFAMVNG
jgi:hypothetical protein